MLTDIQALVYSTLLTFLMIITASTIRTKLWTLEGAALAFGNREHVPEGTPLAVRAERAYKNMLESFPLFIALVAAANFAHHQTDSRVALGATIFFWARVAYWPCLLAGIKYLRTAIWSVSLVGLALIAAVLL